jgi:FdrA protein
MLKTIIKKGNYHDSVVLMLLTNKISTMEGVSKVSIMMATPSNKDIYKQSGMATPELLEAGSNDMAIVVETQGDIIDQVLKEVEDFFKSQSAKSSKKEESDTAISWDKALEKLPDANLAVISIPGIYAASEADRALDENLNVFMFSDNVTLEDEKRLKEKAHKKGLLVMGPDCGTGIIKGVPIAFTNNVTPGKIGIVGASGTGIQELTTIIDRLGEGVTNAIGTGGRDLSEHIGAITMMDSINAMEEDKDTEVIIVISKPPAEKVRNQVVERLRHFKKPVVTLFLGEKPEVHEENFYHAYTLDEAARIAVRLLRNEGVQGEKFKVNVDKNFSAKENKTIKGYYSGGTLAAEAAMMIRDILDLSVPLGKQAGYMLNTSGHIVVDLGDDVYTQGKPHPMIDPTKRVECMKEAAKDESTGVILFDIVLGYGSHEDMAGALLPAIKELQEKAKKEKKDLHFVTTICGTRKDYQNYDKQKKIMEDVGVIVCESNKQAVETSLALIGYNFNETEKPVLPMKKVTEKSEDRISEDVRRLLQEKPKIINVGLESFSKVLKEFSCEVVQYNWTPPAGGDMQMIGALNYLRNYKFS